MTSGRPAFQQHAEHAEGSDTTPHPKRPCFGVQAAVCDPAGEGECVLAFVRESERGPFVDDCAKTIFRRVIPIDGSKEGVFVTAFERPLKSV